MSLTLVEGQILNKLTGLLYDFLPGSGNSSFSFPLAARQAGVAEFWVPGSKRPTVLRLLEGTLGHQRHRFCALTLAVVRLSMGWRSGKGDPLTLREIDRLNALLLRLEFKVPELHDRRFRAGLASGAPQQAPRAPGPDPARIEALVRDLIALANLDPTPRGIAFERFLTETFALFGLALRSAFSLRGEQIDGSFHLDSATYLLEAKWQGARIGARELRSFAGSVHSKASWTRGLFVSYSSFTAEGLDAFARGNATNIICLDGPELWKVLSNKLDLADVLIRKTRQAGETGRAFDPESALYKDLPL